VFHVSVRALAIAFARLASGDLVPDEYAAAAARVRTAMMANPFLVGGTDRFDTDLMQAGAGRIVSKGGAQGGQGIGLVGPKLGLGLKISDGSPRPIPCVCARVLKSIAGLDGSFLDSLARFHEPDVLNHAGVTVGRITPTFTIEGTIH
jgi:L-asparaginase II